MHKKFFKKVEVWGNDDGVYTISDYTEKESEPVIGVIISHHYPVEYPDYRTSLENDDFIYIEQDKIDDFIAALQEFSTSQKKE